MRKLLYLFLLAVVLYSCRSGNEYAIRGLVVNPEFEGTKVYLQQMEDGVMVATDSALVTSGAFVFSGSLDSIRLRFVSLDKSVAPLPENRVPILLEQGSISVTFDSVAIVAGTKINEAYNVFRTKERDLAVQIRNVKERLSAAATAGLLTEEMMQRLIKFRED